MSMFESKNSQAVQLTRLLLGASTLALTIVSAPVMAQETSQPAAPASQTPDANAGADATQEVVVTGFRASLQRGTDIKRKSAEIVDAISSEDLGKLPDQNIAEGLQRITGVQISRSAGEGNRFQIRGSDQNLTLVDGVEVAPDGDLGTASPVPSRQINLINYPSELFSEVVVYKSPSASLIEGGVGGTVDLRMPDPLEAHERVALTGNVGYFDLSKKAGYDASALASKRFFGNTLGILVGATYFKRDTVTDAFNGSSYFTTSALDVNGDGAADPNIALPYNMTYSRQYNDRTRATLNAVVSWQPSDRFKMRLDGAFIHDINDTSRGFVAFNLSAARTPTNVQTQKEANGTTSVLSGDFSNVLVSQDGLAQNEIHNIYQGDLSMQWDATDRLQLSGAFAASKSNVHSLLTVYQAYQKSVTAAINMTSQVPGAHIVTGGALNDPSAYQAYVTSIRYNETNPTLYQGRGDLVYKFDNSFLSKISIGGRVTHQTFDNTTLQNRFQNTFPIGTNFLITEFPQYVHEFKPDNFFAGADGGYPTDFIAPVVNPSMSDAMTFLQTIGDNRSLQPQPVSNYDITENTQAAYGQIDWDTQIAGLGFSGNVGARYVATQLTSSSSAALADGSIVPVSYKNDYHDFLPSLNMKLDLTSDLVARVSAAKVMSRPPLQYLSAGTTIQFSSGLSSATSGQPLLKPFRAKQVDAGLEYYLGRSGMISGTVFYQQIESYVTTITQVGATLPSFPGQTFFLTEPANGPGGKAKGFEFGAQHSFDFIAHFLSDFGTIVNYTYVDSRRKGSSLSIENTSKNSFNVIGYYEHGPFQARFAYNWRDKQYLGVVRNANTYASARGQLDGSVSYDISKHMTVSLEASDLLESPQKGYADYVSRPNDYEVNDRRIYLGLRANF